MKAVLFFIASVYGLLAPAQNTLLINELQASNQGSITAPAGGSPDWVEIYNPTNRTLDLLGMRLAITGDQHIIDASLKVPARGFRILWCSAQPELGADHLGFTLPRTGGSVLLIAADGTTILDVFTYPRLFANESIGRQPDGARTWRFFSTPSPGAGNNPMFGIAVRTPRVQAEPDPGLHTGTIQMELRADERTIIYTTDGSTPTTTNGSQYTGPIPITTNTAIRAKAFSAEGVPGPEFAGTYLITPDRTALSLIIDGPELWDPATGIDVNGPLANYSRTGREWERPAYFQPEGERSAFVVGIRISGSGTRSLAKRSFKVFARNRYDSPADPFTFVDGSTFDEGLIRADASPNAFLRNMLMEVIATQAALKLVVQPSHPVPVYINANYHGLYRWMPPKDAQWFRHLTGAEEVDVLEGPAYAVNHGSDQNFNRGLDLLFAAAPVDSIARYFDLESLIDLACLDLFTGRADHDLNVRAYRPRVEGGQWKWVLFDMDLWAPLNDNSLERMSTATTMETPFITQLMAHPELRSGLLTRMAALLAGDLAPANTLSIIDSIHAEYAQEIERDHQRWAGKLERPSPQEALDEMRTFLQGRGSVVLKHLAARTGIPLRTVNIEVPDPSMASMSINGVELQPGRQRIQWFSGIPMDVDLGLAEGVRLISWTGHPGNETSITIKPSRTRQLRPRLTR